MPGTDPLRSAAFRVAAAYAGLFALSAMLLFGAAYWAATREMTAQLRTEIRSDARALADAFAQGGRDALEQEAWDRQSDARGAAFYLLLDESGRKIMGDSIPVAPFQGWREVVRQLENSHADDNDATDTVLAFGQSLGGRFLLVGRSMHGVEEMQETLLQLLTAMLGLTLLLALAGGLVMGRSATRRVGKMSRAVRQIVSGDLSRRLPASGPCDEIRGLAEDINRMLARIEELMDNLRQVSNDIAHDLRTPLGRLRQQLEAARQNEHSVEGCHAAIDGAIVEIDALLQTFSALLRIAQVEAGARRQSFSDVDLADLAARIVELYVAAAEDGGRTLAGELEPGVVVHGDQELLTLLLANLVENALRHTPPGTHIAVHLAGTEDGPELSVRDNGPGVPEAERDKVFRRFYRLEASRTTPGSGLGLAMAHAICQLHGAGILLADGHPGLWVRVRFPRVGW